MRAPAVVLASILVVLLTSQAVAQAPVFLDPPVDAAIARSYEAPAQPYGAGHRGIDYAISGGSSVRAAGEGIVTFAGSAAGNLAVTIDHGSGLETTYSRLAEIFVRPGEKVAARTWIGRSASAHGDRAPGLHFGVKVEGEYVDPFEYLGPIDTGGAIALAPLEEDPVEDRHVRTCKPSVGDPTTPVPRPNENVAVVVGGITSATDGSGAPPDLFASTPRLGYSRSRTYHFSYRGTNGPDLHEPYDKGDTYIEIETAARRLRVLLAEIARVHPGVDVDLLAHSQGGIVGRTYLAEQARSWDVSQPRIEHFVTFASPHRGVPAADEVDELRSGPLGSRALLSALDLVAAHSDALPPTSTGSVPQLRTHSALLGSLARRDVLFGTRVLTLGIANDALVPAGRTDIPGKPNLVLPADGLWGHSEIVSSERALQVAHGFLAGAGVACAPELGAIERYVPSLVDRGQSLIGEVVNASITALPFL